jgi:anti-sigma regulatory factor (Ser/Thr protein kinase)
MMGYVFMRFGTDFRPENVDRLREKVGECLKRGGIEGSTAFLLLNLMDELICNILEHSGASWIEMEMHPHPHDVNVILRDDGKKFDPAKGLQTESPAEAAESDEGRNLGLYMVSRITSSWTYRRVDERINELDLTVDLKEVAK